MCIWRGYIHQVLVTEPACEANMSGFLSYLASETSLLDTVAVAAVVAAAFIFIARIFAHRSFRMTAVDARVPGPPQPASLIGGNLAQWKKCLKAGRLRVQLSEWADELGDTYFIRIGPRKMLTTRNPTAIRTILQSRPRTFGRSGILQKTMDGVFGGPGLFSANGEVWKGYRRIAGTALNQLHIRRILPVILDTSNRLHAKWNANPENVDIRLDLTRTSFEIGSRVVFGHDPHAIDQDSDFVDHIHTLFASMQSRLLQPFAYWRLPYAKHLWSDVAATETSVTAVHLFLNDLISSYYDKLEADIRASRRPDPPTNLLESLIHSTVEIDSSSSTPLKTSLTRAELIGNASQLLIASEDTTAHTIEWILFHLAQYPERQNAIVDAIKEMFPSREDLNDPQKWQKANTSEQMKPLECFIKESARLRPIAPILVHEAHEDTQIPATVGGEQTHIRVEHGQAIILLLRDVATSSEFFSRPLEFLPERWDATLRTEKLGESFLHSADQVRPFGEGPRVCVGMHLATMEIKAVVCSILFDLEIYMDSSVVTGDISSYDPGETQSFTTFPAVLPIKLRKRTDGQ